TGFAPINSTVGWRQLGPKKNLTSCPGLVDHYTSPPDSKLPVEAAEELVAPFTTMFERLFIWQTGEYIASLTVIAEPGSASYSKKYRFTVYESDTEELRGQVKGYRYGAGIAYDRPELMVTIPLTEHTHDK
ncbi:hypothetical protein, partial [Pseudomonas sp. 3296]|uniref:hypothetical protein n=1 Tax=Pseudomonas sp. 3296 TaxID=2817753 RepID=UPI00286D19D4